MGKAEFGIKALTLFLSYCCLQLTATETMNYDDAFTLEQVTEQLLDKFNFVAGIVPVLMTHIKNVSYSAAALYSETASAVCCFSMVVTLLPCLTQDGPILSKELCRVSPNSCPLLMKGRTKIDRSYSETSGLV